MRRLALALALCCAPVALLASRGAPSLDPAFRSYSAPAGVADDAGEPTLGVNLATGAVLFLSGTHTYRVGEWDAGGAGKSSWTDVSTLLTNQVTADPILETDTTTGRTFVNQLMYSNPGSVMAYTDDDGATWVPVPYGSGVGANIDHQTVGFGKIVAPLTSPVGYPNAIYYCTNDLLYSNCALSLDGGNTFSPAHPAYSTTDCATIHGHLKSAPDGTIYLPPDGCTATDGEGSPAGVVVSEDNSLSWTVRRAHGTNSGDAGHPSLGVASDGTIYLAFGSRSADDAWGPVQVVRSRDKGETWTRPVSLGVELGVKASRFPVTAAGDPDRAAVAFLGTTEAGSPSATAEFTGRWDLYVSMTYDGGATWHTLNATPDNPVQVGSICTGGLGCGGDRNLLDFNDLVIDERGRVLVGLADGCTKKTCTPDDRERHGLIVRQSAGRGLIAAFDPKAAPAPATKPKPKPPAPAPAPQPAPGGGTLPSTGADAALPTIAVALVVASALAAGVRRTRVG